MEKALEMRILLKENRIRPVIASELWVNLEVFVMDVTASVYSRDKSNRYYPVSLFDDVESLRREDRSN